MLFPWFVILILLGLENFVMYMAPAIGIVAYIVFNQCPSFARKMHRFLCCMDFMCLKIINHFSRPLVRWSLVFVRAHPILGISV